MAVTIPGGLSSAPEKLGMQDFLSRNQDLIKSSRFVIQILAPQVLSVNDPGLPNYSKFDTSDLTYLCESAELPGRGFMNSDIRYYGPNYKIPYQTTYEDLNLTFLCRDKFKERKFFDDWMELINPTDTYNFSYRSTYVTTINIFQMSDVTYQSDNPDDPMRAQQRYTITCEEAYPILVNPQPMTWADDNFHRLTITFTYKRWRRAPYDSRLLYGDYGLTSGMNVKGVDAGGNILPTIL